MPNTDDTTEVLQLLAENLGEDARDKLAVAVADAFQPIRDLAKEAFIYNNPTPLLATKLNVNGGQPLSVLQALDTLQAAIMDAALPEWREKHVRGFVDDVRRHAVARANLASIHAERTPE